MVSRHSCRWASVSCFFCNNSALFWITASGVLISWETLEKKSVFSVSMLPSSSTILLKSMKRTSRWVVLSRGCRGGRYTEKSPEATFRAASEKFLDGLLVMPADGQPGEQGEADRRRHPEHQHRQDIPGGQALVVDGLANHHHLQGGEQGEQQEKQHKGGKGKEPTLYPPVGKFAVGFHASTALYPSPRTRPDGKTVAAGKTCPAAW